MRAVPSIASGTRHVVGVGLQALLIAAILGLAALAASAIYKPAAFIAGVDDASAARNSGHISVPDGDYGGTTVATVNPGGDVWVRARCYQGGGLVYEQYVRPDGDNQATLTLGPTPNWTSGDADCTAQEGSFGRTNRWKAVAETTFNAWDR